MPAPASGPSPSSTSPSSTAAPPRWPCARAGGSTPCSAGGTPTTLRVLTHSRSAARAVAVPFLPAPRSRAWPGRPHRPAHGRDAAHRWRQSSARWTLRRLVGWAGERLGLVLCRETIRTALHRRKLSWKKAKKLLGRADPERRQAFNRLDPEEEKLRFSKETWFSLIASLAWALGSIRPHRLANPACAMQPSESP